MRNGVQLITYADRLGRGGIPGIRELLTGPLKGVFTGVHILPFFTPFDGEDAGFDPTDHLAVDPRLGDWGDVRLLSESHDVMADLIVNHISDQSPQFIDFVALGDESRFAGMFLERETIFPGGATAEEMDAIYRPRPGPPFTAVRMADGSRRFIWTTFTPHQVDIDVHNGRAKAYLNSILDRFSDAGVDQVRLDAVGYAAKTRGTSCFMTDATYDFIEDVGNEIRARSMVALLEIHSHYLDQVEAAFKVDRVYDFALPPLVLHALYSGSAVPLTRWLEGAPRNAFTVLDTHDGIGVVDVGSDAGREGLLSPAQIDELVEGIHEASKGESRKATGTAASNLDLYQVNSTYYSALGCDDNSYLLARLIQFLSPGIPQVYYAGILAAPNDMGLLDETGVGRDINRPYYERREVLEELDRPIVRQLLDLCRFRNAHPAFDGTFSLLDGAENELLISWENSDASVRAAIDVDNRSFTVESSVGGYRTKVTDWSGFATTADVTD